MVIRSAPLGVRGKTIDFSGINKVEIVDSCRFSVRAKFSIHLFKCSIDLNSIVHDSMVSQFYIFSPNEAYEGIATQAMVGFYYYLFLRPGSYHHDLVNRYHYRCE